MWDFLRLSIAIAKAKKAHHAHGGLFFCLKNMKRHSTLFGEKQ